MMLEIRDVKKSFGGQTVLDGISLDAVPELPGNRGQRESGV